MNKRRTASPIAGAIAYLVLLAAGLDAGAAPSVRDRSLPDLDQRLGAVLDLASGELAPAPRPAAFADVEAYNAALARLGDLAYEDAQEGMLFIASGFALPLGTDTPGPAALRGLDRRLEARTFLRRSEIGPGAWFAVRTRAGALCVARVVARTGTEIRLAWSPPQSATAALPAAWIDAIAALHPPQVERALLPPIGTTPESVLRLADGNFRAAPALAEPLATQSREALVESVGRAGDLAYFRPRAGLLVVPGGKVARLGMGPVAALSGRDLSERLRERPFVSTDALTPGSVLLIGTTNGKHALVRVDAIEPAGLRISWLLQPDGSAFFPDLAAFDASFEIPGPQVLDRLLLAAAARGDTSEMQRLLAIGANPNTTLGNGARPPLVRAVIDGDAAAIALLLAAGADPAGTGNNGWNALHVAAKLGRTDVVEALLAAGGDSMAHTSDGANALQIALDSPRQNLDLIRLLREQPGTTDTLSLAARVGDVAAIRSMLAQGVEVDYAQDGGVTALEVAAATGQSGAVRALLAAGADPSLESAGHSSALVAAAAAGHAGTVALLVEHGGSTGAQKSSALYRANIEGSAELARILLDGGANAEEHAGESLTPLGYALQYGDDSLVDAYVARGYALDVAAAARLGRVDRLDALLAEGGDPNRAAPDGRSPLQLAIENDRRETVQMLLEHGVAADAPLPTWDWRTPLHEAAARADPAVVGLLIDRGADANRLDRVGRSPLYDAVVHGREETVRVLLEAGADPNLAPAGEALVDIARRDSIRTLLARHGARSAADSPSD